MVRRVSREPYIFKPVNSTKLFAVNSFLSFIRVVFESLPSLLVKLPSQITKYNYQIGERVTSKQFTCEDYLRSR
jgi:hypothetical protein